MPDVYQVLGQSIPAVGVNADLYTGPIYTGTVVSSLTVCNQAATATTFTIAVRPIGAALQPQHYICYNTYLSPNDTVSLTMGMTLAQTDVVTVSSASGSVSFVAFGGQTPTMPVVVPPVISQLVQTNNTFTANTGSGASANGGYLKVLGSNFTLLSQVFVAGQPVPSTRYISSSELWSQVPPQAPGTYSLMVFNGSGGPGSIYSSGITYS